MSVLDGRRLVVLDVETTGWDPALGHTILEVGCVTVEGGARGETWSSLVGPRRPVDPESSRIHGITEPMLDGAPGPAEVAREVRTICGDDPLVFHNAAFDLPFLNALMRARGVPRLFNPVVDTLGLARGLFGSGDNALGPLAERLGIPPVRRHRALEDAATTADVMLALTPRWERERGVRSLDELAAASQDAIRLVPRRMPEPARQG
jgi:DNA polymerase III epsilon subunit family exonuclease